MSGGAAGRREKIQAGGGFRVLGGAGLGGADPFFQVLEEVLKDTKKDGKSVGFLWSQGGDQFEMEEARDARTKQHFRSELIRGAGFAVWLPGGRTHRRADSESRSCSSRRSAR